MERGKLIIVEGVDHLGKSEMTTRFISKYGDDWRYHHQPDDSCEVTSFVRNYVKQDESLNAFENQLLHCWSHCFHYRKLHETIFKERKNILLDRCHLSALAYGSADGLDIEIVRKLELASWADLPVDAVIYFYSDTLYPTWMKSNKETLEDAKYERKGDEFRKKLIESYKNQIKNFKFKEKIIKFDVNKWDSIDEEFKEFEKIICSI